MSYQFAISDIGLRLIKAYEGFRPEGLTTREGRKIVGYGRITDDHALKVNEQDAEKMLKSDLRDIETLVNTLSKPRLIAELIDFGQPLQGPCYRSA